MGRLFFKTIQMETCLTNVIKLSRTTCECFEDKPNNYNDGQSEVYLDELEGLELIGLGGAENCEEGSIWDMMDRARENATLQFKTDLLSCINLEYKSKRPNYSGVIGQSTFSDTLNIANSKAGVVLEFPSIEGGYFKLRKIGTIMNSAQAISVSIYDNDQYADTPLASYTINSAANALAWASLATPLELPLWSKNVSTLRYYIVYDVSGFMPKNNKADCGCGGVKPAWMNWFSVSGIKGSGTAYSGYSRTKFMNGLLFNGDVYCQSGRLICTDESPLDFDNDMGRSMQIAYAIRFKAGEILVENILASSNINRYTLLDRERLWGKRNHYRKLYNDWIQYLCDNAEIGSHDCLVCRGSKLITTRTIIA